MPRREWTDASAATYTAESTWVNGHLVTVCLDDEGPMRPAFYWDIDNVRGSPEPGGHWMNGWASSIRQARHDSIEAAICLPKGDLPFPSTTSTSTW